MSTSLRIRSRTPTPSPTACRLVAVWRSEHRGHRERDAAVGIVRQCQHFRDRRQRRHDTGTPQCGRARAERRRTRTPVGCAGLIAVNGAEATANATADVDAQVSSGATLDAGSAILIESLSRNIADARGDALTGAGFVSFGAIVSTAVASGATTAHMNGDVLDGTTVTISADATEMANA